VPVEQGMVSDGENIQCSLMHTLAQFPVPARVKIMTDFATVEIGISLLEY